MRIVDNRKDYYDGVQGMDEDRELLYVRRPEEVKYGKRQWNKDTTLPEYPLFELSDFSYRYTGGRDGFFVQTHTIGFCGKVHLCLEVSLHYAKERKLPTDPFDYDTTFCYSVGDVDEFVRRNFPRQFDDYAEPLPKHYWRESAKWAQNRRRAVFAECFAECEKRQDEFAKMFEEKRTPVFVGTKTSEGGEVKYNALLKPYNFQRVKDPYTAYQDIRMFISNIAVPEKPMIQLSNEDMAASKGHGGKYSFRKAPSK